VNKDIIYGRRSAIVGCFDGEAELVPFWDPRPSVWNTFHDYLGNPTLSLSHCLSLSLSLSIDTSRRY